MNNAEIEKAVNKIIKDLNPKDFDREAVNWSDIKVCDVEQIPLVTIDEAAPDSYLLRQVIQNTFKFLYGFEIKVVTESGNSRLPVIYYSCDNCGYTKIRGFDNYCPRCGMEIIILRPRR